MDNESSLPSIEEMERIRSYYSKGNDLQTLIDIAGMTADCLKSGKLVFVVRCKDCKYYNTLIGHCKDGRSYPSPDWFCADGELK